ncbi:MAG: hypothetical protein GTN62_07945 [Gemmatimonadales bacterium]|nr:hypothetical protein [Gemmatimonadales bacterium]NIN50032.1 hypothetical protein [Gemmatimonadales bacterium]NIP07496.1 hypothetical protein [Gemmatimonadales bacterium]NIR03135.1 hypothetical protein [Gemmatimonadales bacterium]NIS66847.1 hypothetical protein [Gemmatimonadales bacterium]
MKRRALALLALAAAFSPADLEAQASVYSVLGIGFPGRAVGVRARSLGGAIEALDPGSAVNPAAVAGFRALRAVVTTGSTFRRYETDGLAVEGLRDTRFPFAVIGGPVARTPVSFAASYALYADRTFDLQTGDTLTLRGATVPVGDQISSDGAVTDLRGALAWVVSRSLQVGAGVHIISGSTREVFDRAFGDTNYTRVRQQTETGFSAVGFSAGVTAAPTPWLRLGAAVRTDTRLAETRGGLVIGRVNLPTTVSGGVILGLTPTVRWSLGVTWRSWSTAADDVAAHSGASAFDTWEVGSGIELGATSRIPLRAGFRYAELPFSPTSEQVREIDLAAGAGVPFAGNRAAFEFAVERQLRDGGGATERAWFLSFSLWLRP